MSQAATGRKMSWPVAVLAASRPTTRPRRAVNQRLATMAPRTSAVRPVPAPSSTPQSRNSCHSCVTRVASASDTAMKTEAVTMTRRRPKRVMNIAANGPIRPKSTKRTANTDESCSVLQPNSLLSGGNMAPGRPSAAEVVSMAMKVTAATTQP